MMGRTAKCLTLASLHLLLGCTSNPPLPPLVRPEADVLLIIIGGNSESIDSKSGHRRGMRKLYFGHDKADESPIVQTLAKTEAGQRRTVAVRYFSWTGDNEFHPGILPGHANWILGGNTYIQKAVPEIGDVPSRYRRLVIAGWSNGGATAYELACLLTSTQADAVSLLITLDPVAWTTRECRSPSGASRRPATGWINVYTASGPSNRLETGNIVAFVGRAWDGHFPRGIAVRAHADELLPNSNHGDTDRMWTEFVEQSGMLSTWRAIK